MNKSTFTKEEIKQSIKDAKELLRKLDVALRKSKGELNEEINSKTIRNEFIR